jgi:hypothetical protein
MRNDDRPCAIMAARRHRVVGRDPGAVMSNETNDPQDDLEVVEIVTSAVGDDGTVVVDDLRAVVDADGNVLATDETIAAEATDGTIVVDEVVSVADDDGELVAIEEDVTIVDADDE